MKREFILYCGQQMHNYFTINHSPTFYIRGSVHRNARVVKPKKMQQYADIYLLQNHFLQ